jgi:hypothetical protein
MRLEELIERLQEFDLLLDTDPKFPSISGLVVGASVRGSGWAHPKAHEIFRLACELRSHPDVLMVKLISGKVTLIYRPLWPSVFAVGTAREAWQMQALSREAKALLKQVEKEIRVNASGDPVRELEAKLLVYSESVHTDRGFHTKQVQTWESWADAAKLGGVDVTPEEAKSRIEHVVPRLNQQFHANGTLPWAKRESRDRHG